MDIGYTCIPLVLEVCILRRIFVLLLPMGQGATLEVSQLNSPQHCEGFVNIHKRNAGGGKKSTKKTSGAAQTFCCCLATE